MGLHGGAKRGGWWQEAKRGKQNGVGTGDAEIPVQHPLQTRTATHSTGKAPCSGEHEGEIARAETHKVRKKRGDQQQQQAAQGKNNRWLFTCTVFFPRDTPANESVTERAEHQALSYHSGRPAAAATSQRQDRQFAGEDRCASHGVHPRGELLRKQRFCNTSSNSRLHQWAKLVCEAMCRAAQRSPEETVGSLLSVAQPEGSVRSLTMSIRHSRKRPSTGTIITLTNLRHIRFG